MPKRTVRILVVEDTASLAITYAGQLETAGYTVEIAETGQMAREKIAAAPSPYKVILLDLQLPDCDGLEWLAASPELLTESSVIVVTADGSIKRAISAMRLGAYDFLVKPLAPERLTTSVRNAVERIILANEVTEVRKLAPRDRFQGFVGKSNAMQTVYRAIESVADSKATVFVTGESGTGKEVAAEAIHRAGRRKTHPFVAVNCGAIPENLLESELFGHVKGSFTGALENRTGAAKEADGGTLFLDEVCEMEMKLQVKLLRFLQTGTIQRVGSNRPEPVDVRVICATNRNPAREVAAGRFREDLFYRLSVIPVEMPALRDRGADIELLAQSFLEKFATEEHKRFDPLGPEVCELLLKHNWPGNVRELQNCIRRAVVMSNGPVLTLKDFDLIRPAVVVSPQIIQPTAAKDGEPGETPRPSIPDAVAAMTLMEIERWAVEEAIKKADGSIPGAARSLGISPSTLYRMRERWARASDSAA